MGARQVLPSTNPKLMAVIPAFNEAGNIARVIREIRDYAPSGLEIDLVVIDDGSRDKTRVVASKAGAPVVALPYNMGIGMSVQTGFKYAVSRNVDYVVQVDGDGQHIASEISKLLETMNKEKVDVVIGTRFAKGQKDGLKSTTFLRWFVGRALAWTVHFLTGRRLSDTTSGFRLFNRKAAEFVAHSYPDDYPEVQVLVMLAVNGFAISEVPVQMRSREHGTSSINWWRSIYYVFKVVFASIMDKLR